MHPFVGHIFARVMRPCQSYASGCFYCDRNIGLWRSRQNRRNLLEAAMGSIFDDVVTEDLVDVLDAEQYVFDAFLAEAKEFLHCKV